MQDITVAISGALAPLLTPQGHLRLAARSGLWSDFAARYVTALCAMPEGGEIAVAVPENSVLDTLIVDLLTMTGGETAATSLPQGLQSGLESGRSSLFNLAENRKDPDAPFAFLSTHSSRLSARGKAQHQSLSRALAEFSDGKSKA